ncbi:hypothetical protein AABB24_029644 [Solanum stoloniferum]|uniref:Uncharacterized protein n=1 Tax=Solanum stoloniferum TaxID=62892 RepID=A0ABD2S0P3_9SOLN
MTKEFQNKKKVTQVLILSRGDNFMINANNSNFKTLKFIIYIKTLFFPFHNLPSLHPFVTAIPSPSVIVTVDVTTPSSPLPPLPHPSVLPPLPSLSLLLPLLPQLLSPPSSLPLSPQQPSLPPSLLLLTSHLPFYHPLFYLTSYNNYCSCCSNFNSC